MYIIIEEIRRDFLYAKKIVTTIFFLCPSDETRVLDGDFMVDKEDFRLFLKRKVLLNIRVNGLERFYSGDILKLNDDSILFRDKFGALLTVNNDSIIKMEEIKKGNKNKSENSEGDSDEC